MSSVLVNRFLRTYDAVYQGADDDEMMKPHCRNNRNNTIVLNKKKSPWKTLLTDLLSFTVTLSVTLHTASRAFQSTSIFSTQTCKHCRIAENNALLALQSVVKKKGVMTPKIIKQVVVFFVFFLKMRKSADRVGNAH